MSARAEAPTLRCALADTIIIVAPLQVAGDIFAQLTCPDRELRATGTARTSSNVFGLGHAVLRLCASRFLTPELRQVYCIRNFYRLRYRACVGKRAKLQQLLLILIGGLCYSHDDLQFARFLWRRAPNPVGGAPVRWGPIWMGNGGSTNLQ